jgi:cytochrome c oxidase subunit 2
VLLAGCHGADSTHSALAPDGPQAFRIFKTYQLFLWVCAAVWVLVVLFTLVAVWRKRDTAAVPPAEVTPEPPDAQRDRPLTLAVNLCIVLTVIILFGLMITEFATAHAFHSFAHQPNPVTITVTGHQWWWEVRYEDEQPQNVITDANEIHIPTGRPIKLVLQSADVIHSFWVPNLSGKKDMIPNHTTQLWFQADKEGHYEGQCAEFCGHQHAKMRLLVIAMNPQDFDGWLKAARTPARPPLTPEQQRGQQVFVRRQCSMCHTIVGTPAGGRLGPDLTHIASRYNLAANSIPNTPGHLAGWIVDPQRMKPGARMPQNTLDPQDLRNLLEYLRSLQ